MCEENNDQFRWRSAVFWESELLNTLVGEKLLIDGLAQPMRNSEEFLEVAIRVSSARLSALLTRFLECFCLTSQSLRDLLQNDEVSL
jgi:hypothetical protein